MTSRNGSSIGYTSYNLPSVINGGSGTSSSLSYGAFRNRFKQVAVTPSGIETTIYVAGLLEKVTRGSQIEYRHYIAGGKGTAAIHTRVAGGASSTYYLHRDHLGSPELITDSSGNEVVRPSFAAYGERRDGSDWNGPPSAPDLTDIANITRRGFTGHEHLDSVGLIHMNGRVYEPVAGRFLSRDPFVDGVASSQGLNGYAYTYNAPLSFIDPSGFSCEPPEGMSEEEASIYISRCNDEYDAGGWGSIAQNERWCAMLDLGCQEANRNQTRASLAEYLSTCNCEQALIEMLERGRISFTNYIPRGTGYIECGAPGQLDCGGYEPPPLRWSVASMLYVQGHSPDVWVRANTIGLPGSLPPSAFNSKGRAVIFSLNPAQFVVHGSVTIERRGDEYFVLSGSFDFLPHKVTSPWEAARNVSAFLGEAAAGPGIPFMIHYFGPAGSVRSDYREMFPHPVPRW